MPKRRKTEDIPEEKLEEKLEEEINEAIEHLDSLNNDNLDSVEYETQEPVIEELIENSHLENSHLENSLKELSENLMLIQEEQTMEATQEKLSLISLYKELVRLVKDRGIDNVNTFRDIITTEYPDYDLDEVDTVWISIADYASKIHQLYEKIYQYYRIFVQSVAEDNSLDKRQKRQKIKDIIAKTPLAPYVLRVAAGEVAPLYQDLYYEFEGDLNRVMKLLG